MHIVADENILSIDSYFCHYGDLVALPGGEIKRHHLLHADALIVRSITAVNAALLEGTTVKFVGSATSGIDHVDLDYLAAQNIKFVDAKGSNANAVVDYCFTVLAHLAVNRGRELDELEIGLIGAGNVGGLFHRKLAQLGFGCRVHDPYLEAEKGHTDFDFVTLDEALQADIISLHVPFTKTGDYPSCRLLHAGNLEKLRQDAVLINTARGGVVDSNDLLEFLLKRPDVRAHLDVWSHEPMPDSALVNIAEIATPHIAGYSVEAKNQATEKLAREFSHHFQLKSPETFSMGDQLLKLNLDDHAVEGENKAWSYLLQALPLQSLSEEFKNSGDGEKLAQKFAAMRRRLLHRREFSGFEVGADDLADEDKLLLHVMGMSLGTSK
tara:strand:- start:1119 stop:2264 length:1146 start_codon:yes stop_codon:yes gene_type:complete